ncbi:MAG: hypothetical protein HOK21_18010 [Rhodospirillaceae bacterium]|jgi:hypothetical protein|nr:hypothetical protein [Rhodospirillaceae bacterium]MBT4690987.1 hypothetical protein [Rhodospirillaceae bacterium]MBT5079959.1 hypothetical protein [Rhodospirillaceae bacterium]MBT5525981.1 hypothetical protein [Rhodospirillaceae bacterium]MBT5881770.1 hypothetical protein [Rhodospirillaceae bacterium]
MTENILVVLTNPVPGKEDEFNEWYSNIHLQEICQLSGFKSAQRFKLGDAQMGPDGAHRYLAIYEIDGDPAAALEALKAARPDLNMTDALDPASISTQVFGAITGMVTAS